MSHLQRDMRYGTATFRTYASHTFHRGYQFHGDVNGHDFHHTGAVMRAQFVRPGLQSSFQMPDLFRSEAGLQVVTGVPGPHRPIVMDLDQHAGKALHRNHCAPGTTYCQSFYRGHERTDTPKPGSSSSGILEQVSLTGHKQPRNPDSWEYTKDLIGCQLESS